MALIPDAPKASPLVPKIVQLRSTRREGHDIWTLEIEPGEFSFSSGQFNMLYAYGIGEVPISISGDPATPNRLLHTVRAVGAVSRAITQLKPGDSLGLRGPYGSAWPVEEGKGSDLIVVAGGLGLAPLRPAIYRVLAQREHYGRVALLYGARSPEEILFRRELESWRRRLDIAIEVSVDHATGDWRGNVGVVTTLIGRASFDPPHTIAMVCGPEIMMRFSAIALEACGVTPDRIYLSMERNMKCAVGHCGHCQFGPALLCRDGPVLRYDRVAGLITVREL